MNEKIEDKPRIWELIKVVYHGAKSGRELMTTGEESDVLKIFRSQIPTPESHFEMRPVEKNELSIAV